MKRYSKDYIYARVDFPNSSIIWKLQITGFVISFTGLYMQIPEAGHCLTLFGPISGFVPLNRVWFSFTIESLKQGIQLTINL